MAFCSGPDDRNCDLVKRMEELFPELPLYVVSEHPPVRGKWIRYDSLRSFIENWARCRAAFKGKHIRLAGVLLIPRVPYRRMRLIALLLSPVGFLAFNENLDNFMLRPHCMRTIVRHLIWRTMNCVRWQLGAQGKIVTLIRRLRDPSRCRIAISSAAAFITGHFACLIKSVRVSSIWDCKATSLPAGVSVIIPSRNGRALLECLLPVLKRELGPIRSEITVVDNGSGDHSAAWLRSTDPAIRILRSRKPLSFARAVNQGIQTAKYSHICLLNNDMLPRGGFFAALLEAFASVPDLFCATAQIYFPPGMRREETGKAVLRQPDSTDFPVRYDLPISGENLSYVLYGSGGCSLYSAEKIRALGALNEIYEPAYVEDLDVCYRAWLHAWPSVFVAGACVEHRHRATTSRYYSPAQLEVMLEKNYLRFLCHATISPGVFHKLWQHDIKRLRQLAIEGKEPARQALAYAWKEPSQSRFRKTPAYSEEQILALVSGDVAVFPGRRRRDRPAVLIASPYLPFPLAHGGAVRIFNLMQRAARYFDQVLVSFTDCLDTPPGELLDFCTEIVLVRRTGTHSRPRTMRPDVVEEYDSPAFRAALEQSIRKWRPAIAQLEYTQMAQYAENCAPAPTMLVEHDITFDLQEQLLREVESDPGASWELRQELERWRRFETAAWRDVDCVIAMSEEDRKKITAKRAVCVPNGVAIDRFLPSHRPAEFGSILFIGSFGHLPNLLAVEFLLSHVWPLLQALSPTLHIIAGAKHEYFLEHFRHRVNLNLDQPGVELEGFVADVRTAYARAAVVIAPLVVSAGTNIKILEAMAMGKAIVTTPAGVRGLNVTSGEDLIVTETREEMADAIRVLLQDPARRRTLEFNARQTARREYDWDAIAIRQHDIYENLCGGYSKSTATPAGEHRASA